MSQKEQELVQTSGHKEPLLVDQGDFKYSANELKEVVDMDNRYGLNGNENIKISSDLIVNKFGGIQNLADGLMTNLKTGISGSKQDIADRQRIYGLNSFPPPKIKSILELIAENFDDFINQVLCAAAVVSIIIGVVQHGLPDGLIEGTSILIALNIIIFVNSGNNYLSEKRLADLVNLSEKQMVPVYRGSKEAVSIDANELVVGDLIDIDNGNKVPADLIMVSGQDIACVEADLTGEPDMLPKKVINENNLQDHGTLFAKTLIQTGNGKAIVMAVGPNTSAGKITEQTQKTNEPTHLQNKLEVIANKIGNVGVACAILTFCSMVVRTALEMVDLIPCGCGNIFTCQAAAPGCQKPNFELNMTTNPLWNELLNTVIIAITVIVVAIPEGLPLAVTISLSFASKKMQKENNLVRTLSSAETMGGATHICSDKTGTLTMNKMTTMALMAQNQVRYMGQIVCDKLAKESEAATRESGVWDMLVEGFFWNSTAKIEVNQDKDAKKRAAEPFVLSGNVTEQGIIKFFLNVMDEQACIDNRNRLTEDNTCCLISFSSSRKRASIVVRYPAKAGQADEVRIYTKGAPDMLFDFTTNVFNADGSVSSFDDTTEIPQELLANGETSATGTYRELYERTVNRFARQAYRTILMTYRDMSMDEFNQVKADNNNFASEGDREILEKDLTAYAIFGLQDPLRPTIVGSIKECKTAGIRTIMCTGDNIDTATAISINAGIVTQEEIDETEESRQYSCMTGKDFRTAVGGLIEVDHPDKEGKKIEQVKNMKKFRDIKKYLRVLARSSPEDKRILVTGVQDDQGVVAVTGDGTNDAPALTKADVGFAMGITGTDVAKGACDIILLDDNFSSIITALRYGRNVYDNVRKFLQFQLTVNVVAMFIVFFGSVIIKDSPLNAVQMLWVNLIMDTFAALALATEPPADDILTRQPYDKDAPIMSELMWRNVFGHALYQIIILVVIIFVGQGTIVANYTDECFDVKKAAQSPPVYEYIQCDTKGNSVYNPFYTKHLYMGLDGKNGHWAKLPNLKQANFDKTLLGDFSCFVYQQAHFENEQTCAQLQKSADWAKNIVLPADVVKGTGTMKLLHFTYVFQIFVFMQLFNQLNARLLELGEFNIFAGIFRNCIFIFVTILTFVVQIAMVEVGGQITKCFPLNSTQNMICLAFGAFEIVWGVLIKFTPLGMWQFYNLDDKPVEGEQDQKSLVQKMKGSSKLQRTPQEKIKGDLQDAIKQKYMVALANKKQEQENALTINN